ncbi:hypothetical protein [Fervidibacillus halotolerans]|uniref:Uncharacterized protein n=1 Tax=Fervidibacillus halotolerans TaxID=2980027 RepID=A0A9E8RX76_9BACI|nr:hypothetical protein [Fervidibacillus halotolerans]WAA11446.1 hypothetical protein OE105_07310 [Fervidibacillus halotolerans]
MRRKMGSDQSASIYLEFLFAFSIWLIILSFTLPAFLYITIQRMEVFSDQEATFHVTEQTINYILEEPLETEINGKYTDYFVTVERMENSVNICVRYFLKNQEEKCVCRSIQRR